MNENETDMTADEHAYGYRPPYIGRFVCKQDPLDPTAVVTGIINFQYSGDDADPIRIVVQATFRDLQETTLYYIKGAVIGPTICNHQEVVEKVRSILTQYLTSDIITTEIG